MWTKGMIMFVTGISGVVLTTIWIIVLLILSSRKRKRPPQYEESVVYTRPVYKHEGPGGRKPVKDTVVLHDNMSDTDVL